MPLPTQATEGAPAPDANASPKPSTPPSAAPEVKGSEADSSPAAAPSEKAQPEDGRDLRIKELTRRLRQTERDRERLLRMHEQRGQPSPSVQPQPPPQATKRKSFADFGYNNDAYAEYLRTELASELPKAPSPDELYAEFKQRMAKEQRREKFEARATEFSKATEDYQEVIEGPWNCSEPMAEAIEQSEEGPAIAYYLAQNPEVADELSKLGAVRAGQEIDRIEAKLVSERKKAAAKRVSQAPPPPPTIDASDPGSSHISPLKMTPEERAKLPKGYYAKWREKTIARRR